MQHSRDPHDRTPGTVQRQSAISTMKLRAEAREGAPITRCVATRSYSAMQNPGRCAPDKEAPTGTVPPTHDCFPSETPHVGALVRRVGSDSFMPADVRLPAGMEQRHAAWLSVTHRNASAGGHPHDTVCPETKWGIAVRKSAVTSRNGA